MEEASGGPDQVLGARVTLTALDPGRKTELAAALAALMPEPPSSPGDAIPLLVLETPSREEASSAFDILEEAGGTVSIERVWVDRGAGAGRTVCPSCGSKHTQPFGHAGPAARVNTKCIDCGHLFKVIGAR
ncbi:MAG: hypothetical protein WD004_05730 [Actinomycetota bacterium]